MVVLLDTDQITEPERAEALDAVYRTQSPQGTIKLDHSPIRHRLERLDFGPEAHLLRRAGNPVRIVRTGRHVRMAAPEYVAIGLHRRGKTVLSAGDVDTELQPGELSCVDLTRPCSVAHHSWNSHEILIVSNERAGVSVDLVRAAGPALASSPLYDLVRAHLAGLFDATRDLPSQLRELTSQATIVLIRALLATAAPGQNSHDAMLDALEVRITLYIEAHLNDPDLGASRIAHAHNISLRHLYSVWTRSGHGLTLSQWIIDLRLRRAREQLASPNKVRTSVATIARDCGFIDPTHFSRRFRETFGISPVTGVRRTFRRNNRGFLQLRRKTTGEVTRFNITTQVGTTSSYLAFLGSTNLKLETPQSGFCLVVRGFVLCVHDRRLFWSDA